MSNSEKSDMAGSEIESTEVTDRVAKLRAIFEPATQKSQRVQRRFTRNAPKTALGDVCQSPASETLENSAKDDEEREQQSVMWTTGEKGSLKGKQPIQDKNMMKGLETEQGQSKEDHTPSSRLGNTIVRRWEAKVEHKNFTHGLDAPREKKHYLHKEIPPLNEEMTNNKMLKVHLSLNAECEMESVTKLRAIFEPATQESQHVQRRFTRNAPIKALGDVFQGPAPETLEQLPKDDGLQTASEEHLVDLEYEKRQLLEENKAQNEDYAELCRRAKRGTSKKQCAAVKWEIAELKCHKGAMQERIERIKSKLEQQAALKQQLHELEGVRNGLCEDKEAVQDELNQLCDEQELETYIEMCLEKTNNIKKEIATLQEEVTQATSTLEQIAVIKLQVLELEDVRNGLCEDKEAVQDELNQLCDEQDPETYIEMCLEKTYNIKKEIATLQEEVTQATSTLEQIAVIKLQVLELEDVRNGLCEDKEAVQDELNQLCDEQEPETYIEMCLEKTNNIKKEIATLQEEVTQATSTLEQIAVIKLQVLELEDVRNGLCEDKEAVEDELNLLYDELETSKEMCLEKTNNIKKEIATLQEEVTQATSTLEQIAVIKLQVLEFEDVRNGLCEDKEAVQDELNQLYDELETSKEMCLEKTNNIKKEIATLQEEVTQAKSTLEQMAVIKLQVLELEDVRNGLCEDKEAVQDELNQLCDEQEPETYIEMCLEKTNNIKKEIATLQEEVTQATSTLEQIAVIKLQVLEFEDVRNGLCEDKEAVQDELNQLYDELETSKEMCLEKTNNIKKEIATLQEEVTQATSTLEQLAVIKLQVLELEDVRNGLCEAKETIQDELMQPCDELETSKVCLCVCLEKANDIQKEIVALKSETGPLQYETELAKSIRERQEGLKDRCTHFEAEKRGICCKNKALEDELEEINSNIELQWSIEYASELQIEIERLKIKTKAMQEEIEQGKAKLEQQPAMKQNCLELEDVRSGLRKEMDKLTQPCDKLEPGTCKEVCLEKANEIEKIAALRSHTGILQGDLESANAELQQQTSLKERCLELQAESRSLDDKNESIRREISKTLEKPTQEESWKHKNEATRVLKHDVESEMDQQLEHKGKLQKELDVQMGTSLKYKQKFQKIDKLRSDNLHQQQDVTEIKNHKSALESYKDLVKEKAKSKQFKKQVVQLQEEFDEPEPVKLGHLHAHSLDELRKEECYLHNKISALDQEMTGKKRLQVHQKSVQAGRAWLLQGRLLQMI